MRKQAIGWILKGAAMGAADAVPGVSGGTIALITGIYERFIAALAGIRPSLLPLIMQGKWRKLWLEVDGSFLLCLGFGIVLQPVHSAEYSACPSRGCSTGRLVVFYGCYPDIALSPGS